MAYRRRCRLTIDQQMAQLDFMEKHPDIITGKGRDTKVLWHILAKKLNAIEGGVKKSSKSWTKNWSDKKSLIKKFVAKQKTEPTAANISTIDMRIIRLLIKCGDLQADKDLLELFAKQTEKEFSFLKPERRDSDQESLSSYGSSKTLPEEDLNGHNNDENPLSSSPSLAEYCPTQEENNLRSPYIRKPIPLPSNSLKSEWNRIANMEEKRLDVERNTAKAQEDTSAALARCALAIETLAGAVNYQGAVVGEALTRQGEMIAEALKAQGKMIAEALSKR